MFVPDRNGDDIPDGEPEVLLDGFEERSIRHNLANGLKWGPDGWLYGRHGILATSYVGKPGTPREQRAALNCSIWRFHPVTRAFEVVTHGTTNPWGHDWDDYGQLFFINTVIGHLWHVVPGAYYKRMYGEHPNPYLYELIDQTADHVHWDKSETWEDIRRGVTDATLKAGGGHAHSGLMIYLGDNWPDEYRNSVFAINYHGKRINHDRLERRGAGYTAHHSPDFATFGDPWFRGVELLYGPDGGIYVLDWSDIGECHDDDGVHRTSGRIFKIVYGSPTGPAVNRDIRKLSNGDLINLQLHRNDWFVREARQALYERAVRGDDMAAAHSELRKMFEQQTDPTRKLRALWCLYVTRGTPESWLRSLLGHPNEHIRAWAVQLLVDQAPPSSDLLAQFTNVASSESSGLVLSFLTSVLRKLPYEQRWALAEALARHDEFSDDPTFPLLLWYGVEPGVPAVPAQAVSLATKAGIPKLRSFIARRLTSALDTDPQPMNALVERLSSATVDVQQSVLSGMSEALRGWRKAAAPAAWAKVAPQLTESSDGKVKKLAQELAVVFGDGRAAGQLRDVVADKSVDLNARRRALETLVQSRAEGLVPVITNLLTEMDIAPDAIRSLAALGNDKTPDILLQAYAKLRSYTAKVEAINAMASRATFARPMLATIKTNGSVKRQTVGALQIRQLRSLGDPEINQLVAELWPEYREISAEKQGQILRYKQQLTPDKLAQADVVHGRTVFNQLCGTCHVLFGEGAAIGPELTGSDRKNLDYLLNNIVDPSGVVAENYRVSVIRMKDDRVINGVVGTKTDRTVTVQTPMEKLVLERAEIESITESELSMMPDGLLDSFKPAEVRDLIAYLMATAPPPKDAPPRSGQ